MIKALLFPRLMFLAAVSAMLAGNASAATIQYHVDEFTDEKSIFFATALKRMGFMCNLKGTVMILYFEEELHDPEWIDVKIRINDAPYKEVKALNSTTLNNQVLVFGIEFLENIGGAMLSEMTLLDGWSLEAITPHMDRFLDELVAGDSFIAKVGDSETMRFDLPAIRGKLTQFRDECRELQEDQQEKQND